MASSSNISPEQPPDYSAEYVAAAKRAHRNTARSARRQLDPRSSHDNAHSLAERLLALPELTDARLVLVYSSTAEEISLQPAVAGLRARGVNIAYPRIEEAGVLALHLINDEAELVPGPFGISEPAAEAPRPDPSAIDAVIVPGVAFDPLGARIGFGGGFYDRLLPLVRRAHRIGVAFDEQIAETLPVEPHDVLMDAVVTPTRTLRIRSRSEVDGAPG